MRRCAGCGRRAPKGELVRLALCDGALILDRTQRLEGRGVYLCSNACLARAKRRAGLRGAFDRLVSIDAQTVESVG